MLIADSLRHLFIRLGFAVVAATFVALVASLFVQPAAAEKTLRVATYGLPPGLGNPHTSTNHPTIFTWMAFFDTITYVDAQGTTNPGLAVAWESKGTDTWLLTLRPGVKFQNGEAFNANAVVANLEYLLSEKGRTTSVFREIHGLASARAVDDLTVEIRTKIPNPILAAQLGTLRVFAPGHWADLGP
ncbi:MAG: ABC transporter substrate-binding protein, partial [Pirellulaceae bacterium]|nr:ABC transporter substrate-binding protein [Pirellulaceae bacterium]